jgi:hypothetical protein
MPIKKVELKDKAELRALLLLDAEAIEKGLRLVDDKGSTNVCFDILGIDKEDIVATVILESGVAGADVARGATKLLESDLNPLVERYLQVEVDDIRLIIIARNFTEEFRRHIVDVSWTVETYRYQAVASAKGEKGIVCMVEKIPQTPPATRDELATEWDHLDYIDSDPVRVAADSVLEHIRGLGAVSISPTPNYIRMEREWGKTFAWMRTYRSHFILGIDYFDEDNSYCMVKHDIKSTDGITDELKEDLRKSYELAL